MNAPAASPAPTELRQKFLHFIPSKILYYPKNKKMQSKQYFQYIGVLFLYSLAEKQVPCHHTGVCQNVKKM